VNFSDLNNRHAGATILICGTGPSLDTLTRFTGPRIFLNRAAFVLPASAGETYWMTLDDCWSKGIKGPWAEHLAAVKSGAARTIGVFRDPLLADHGFTPVQKHENIIGFGDAGTGRDELLKMSRDQIAQVGQLYQFCGTGSTAVHLAWYMGAGRIVLAGLDGGAGHAKRLDEFYDAPIPGAPGYSLAQEKMRYVIEKLEISVAGL
jgi:hypothetical protein